MDGCQPVFSAKFVKLGQLTSDFLGNVEGWSLPPRRPVDRCDELRLVKCLIGCQGRSERRSFHVVLQKNMVGFAEKHGTFACLAPPFVKAGWLAERRPLLEDGLAALELEG